jgi:TolB-like protein
LPAEFASEVRRELQRILGSSQFSKSPQAANLLSFLVHEALAFDPVNTPGHLKEYSIAVQVFGRPASFDPASDNIVRVEVRRVRSKVERYYEDEGACDPIAIMVPKGSYVPVFLRRDNSEFDLSGRTVSHYELGRRRCVNRWQSTYDARCLHLQRNVTVILPARLAVEDGGRRQSLLGGVRAGAVDHPNVASVHNVEATNERIIIAASAMPGQSLREYVELHKLSGSSATAFAQELANSLASGHSVGMLHGNLNPDSVSVENGTGVDVPHPRILPFGMFPLVDIQHPAFEGFRPPEWSAGSPPDLRSDVWSFGALVWFSCCGVPPSLPQNAVAATPDGGPIPPRLAAVVARCLDTNPSLRHASAVEISEHIAPVSETLVHQVEAPPRKELAWMRRKVFTRVALIVISLVAVVVTIIANGRLRQPALPVANPRLVVLPLENLGDSENEPYCRAAADLLAARLARFPGVRLVSSRSLDRLKHDHFSTQFLQNELDVAYAVDGTLLRFGSQFQVTVRLLDVGSESYVWANSYIGPWSDVSVRIEELAERAAESMGLLVQREQKRPPSAPPVSEIAREAWLKGRFSAIEYWNNPLPTHFVDAERRLKRALELHPGYVEAMVELGQLYLSAAYPPSGNQADLLEKAQELAESAVTLEPENGAAHALRGSVYTDTGRARSAMPHLLRALQLSPDAPTSHNYLCIAYEAMGFWESSLFEREKAIERDPLLRGIQSGGMPLLVRLGRIKEAQQVLASHEPGSQTWGLRTAWLYLLTGDPKRAESVLSETKPPLRNDSFEMLIALARAAQGGPEIARSAVKELATPERRRWEAFIQLCALAGEKDLLVKEIANHTYVRNYRWVVGEPLLRPYRNHPPFQKLVRDLYAEWQQNLGDFGPSLPVQPPELPSPKEYLSQK